MKIMMENINNFDQEPNEYFNKIEKQILKSVETITKSLLETFRFNFVYSKNVSEKQEKLTEKSVKTYRTKYWKMALNKADEDKDRAYKIYTKNLKLLS